MTCCNERPDLDNIYLPLNKRLIEYGMEVYGELALARFPSTFMWIFSFYEDIDLCDECKFKFSSMSNWFNDYGLFTDITRNVKWIIEDEPSRNILYKDLGFCKTPMHIFADSNGKILDIVSGFPTVEWLDKYILPLIQDDMNTYA